MHYLIVDLANTFFRSRHTASRASSLDDKVGMALHVTLMSITAMARKFSPDHVVIALESRSWRKDFYEPYKRNRQDARAAMTLREQEEDKLFWETYEQLVEFLAEKSNCSVIKAPSAEGDDVIARWIALHPADTHTIISSDSDFVQLLDNNVNQFNGVTDELITINGIFNSRDKRVLDKKTREPKAIPDPEWLLFEKCMRGDSSDNVFSAFPGVRTRGTRNRVGLQEAFADRHKQGWAWNNLMLQRWTDHEGNEHRVIDDYVRNQTLIDLTKQPANVKLAVDTAICEQVRSQPQQQVGVKFLKFCGKHNLVKLSEQADATVTWLTKNYTGILNDSNR